MQTTTLLSDADAMVLRARYKRYETWLAARKHRPYKDAEVPEDARITNAERSRLEVYDFVTDPPAKYFAYYKSNPAYPQASWTAQAAAGAIITTWMGDVLGVIVDAGMPWRSNMGDVRRHIVVEAINGKRYNGTAFLSSGDYVRLKIVQQQGIIRENI